MRTAPAVEYPVLRRSVWRVALALLCALAAGVDATWVVAPDFSVLMDAGGVSVILLAVATAAAVGWRASRPSAGAVVWTGSLWKIRDQRAWARFDDGEVEGVEVMLDLGAWMLLRVRLPRRPGRRFRPTPCWLPLERSAAPERWHALRVAVCMPGSRAASGQRQDRPT